MGLLMEGFRATRADRAVHSNPLEEAGNRIAAERRKSAMNRAISFLNGEELRHDVNNQRIGVAVIDAGVDDFILLVANNTITEITFQEACAWREKIFAANAVDILSAQEDAKSQELAKAAEEGYTLNVSAIAKELGVSVLDGKLDGVPVNQLPTVAGLYPMGKQLVFATAGGRGRGRWTDYVEYDVTTKTVTKNYSIRDDGVVEGGDVQSEEPVVIKATEQLANNPFAMLLKK